MFSNVGAKIKNLAEFIFFVSLLIGLVPAILFYRFLRWESTPLAIIVAVVIIVISFVLGWLSAIFVYGYGQLIEDTSSIRKKLEKQVAEQTNIKDTESEGHPVSNKETE